VNEATAPRWLVLATRQIGARPVYAVVQTSALAVGLLALVLLVLLRTDLVASWRQATPPDAPNRFVINVMPEQSDAFQKAARDAGVQRYDWYPMFRGRLVAVNGREVGPDDFAEDRAKRLVDREFNLSNSPVQPPHNEVVAGRWTPEETGAVSVEEGIAHHAGPEAGRHAALRHRGPAERGQGHVAAQGRLGLDARQLLRDVPGEQPARRAGHLHGRVPRAREVGLRQRAGAQLPQHHRRRHDGTINQVQAVLDKVIRAVEFLFGFTLAAGLVVLFAAVTATREERAREFAIMRAVGARGSCCGRCSAPSWPASACWRASWPACRGGRCGLGAGEVRLRLHVDGIALVPLAGALAGAALALAAGWWGLREVLSRPVVETLRRAATE
jgi:putative ABC transport system permease protein